MNSQPHIAQLIKKLRGLPPEHVAEVEDFIDFLSARDEDHDLVQAAQETSERTLHTVWNNATDADYDRL